MQGRGHHLFMIIRVGNSSSSLCDYFSSLIYTPHKKTVPDVLVLHSKVMFWKPAVLIKSGIEHQTLSCFTADASTEADYSCAITWHNKLHLFGGNLEMQQISRLDDVKLKRIGSLSFDHRLGACTIMKEKNMGASNDVEVFFTKVDKKFGFSTDLKLASHFFMLQFSSYT